MAVVAVAMVVVVDTATAVNVRAIAATVTAASVAVVVVVVVTAAVIVDMAILFTPPAAPVSTSPSAMLALWVSPAHLRRHYNEQDYYLQQVPQRLSDPFPIKTDQTF